MSRTISDLVPLLISEITSAAAAADRRGVFGRAVAVLQDRLPAAVSEAVGVAARAAAGDPETDELLLMGSLSPKAVELVLARMRVAAVRALVASAGVQEETWRDRSEHLRGDARVVAVALQLGGIRAEDAYIHGPDDDGYFYLCNANRLNVRAQVGTPEEALAAFEQRAERERAEVAKDRAQPARVAWGGLDFDLDNFNDDLREALAAAFPAGGAVYGLKLTARVQDALAALDDDTNGCWETETPASALAQVLDALRRAKVALADADEKLGKARRRLGLAGGA